MKIIRIACRDNPLGVARAHLVMRSIREYDPDLVPELVVVKTKADDFAGTPLEELADKETLTAQMSDALKAKHVDLCVHGLDEMPVRENPQLPIVAVGRREDARDVMVLPRGQEIPNTGLPIGASGVRRRTQLVSLYPNWRVESIRGGITQQLDKLDVSREYGALVLPASWLIPLGLSGRIYQTYSINQVLPAWGQGITTVQGRAGELAAYLTVFHSVDSWDCALAERAFMRIQGGGGSSAGVFATARGEKVTVHGMIVDNNGKMWEGVLSGLREDAVQIGAALAAQLQLDAAGPLRRKRTVYDD